MPNNRKDKHLQKDGYQAPRDVIEIDLVDLWQRVLRVKRVGIRDDFFEDRVYAVSPKGDVVELPARATPLDFAYHVHTQVGHRCRGAKINGRIVPLTHQVENGDQIEIITGSQAHPSRDWLSPKLGYLAGARARAKVRNWFRLQDRDQHLRQGREILDRELYNFRGVQMVDHIGDLAPVDTGGLVVVSEIQDHNARSSASK